MKCRKENLKKFIFCKILTKEFLKGQWRTKKSFNDPKLRDNTLSPFCTFTLTHKPKVHETTKAKKTQRERLNTHASHFNMLFIWHNANHLWIYAWKISWLLVERRNGIWLWRKRKSMFICYNRSGWCGRLSTPRFRWPLFLNSCDGIDLQVHDKSICPSSNAALLPFTSVLIALVDGCGTADQL